jgi:hypothetical protein
MSDAGDVYGSGVVVNGVDDTIINDADTPLIHAADKFLASARTRNRRLPLNARHNAGDGCSGEPVSSFSALVVKESR